MTSWILGPGLSSTAQNTDTLKGLWGWSTWGTRWGWQMDFFSLENTSSSYCCAQLPGEDGARLFLEVYSDKRQHLHGDKLEHEKFWLHPSILSLTINMNKCEDKLPREATESPCLKITKNLTHKALGKVIKPDLFWAELNTMTSLLYLIILGI